MSSLQNLLAGGGLATPQIQTETAKAHAALTSEFARSSRLAPAEAVGRYLSTESYDDHTRSQIREAVGSIENTIRTKLRAEKISTSIAGRVAIEQEAAMMGSAVFGGLAATNPKAALSHAPRSLEQLRSYASATGDQFMAVVGTSPAQITADRRAALETYDERNNSNIVANTAAYNLQAPRQNEFGETFFPTVVLTHDSVGASIQMKVHVLYEDAVHAVNGSLLQVGRVNILKAVVDPSLIRNDQTRLYPIVRGGGGATDSTANFVASSDVAPITLTQDGQPITTAPLKLGVTLNLMGVSQRDALLNRGALTVTDRIDGAISLDAIYLKLGANGGNKTIKLSTIDQPTADFNQVVQGNTMQMQLNFTTKGLKITDTTKDVSGAAIAALSGLTGLTVRLKTNVFGTVTLDTGDTTVNAASVDVDRINNAAGELLDLTTGAGATAKALFAGATLIGYDLKAYLTNSNLRQRGVLVDQQVYTSLYTVPLLPPITSLRPIGANSADDGSRVEMLVETTHILTSNAAVDALLKSEANLAQWTGLNDPAAYVPELLGPARFLVNPTLITDTVDVTLTAALTDKDKVADIVARITNKLRDMAFRMYTDSAYGVADAAMSNGVAQKPLVIIGCDPIIERYLTIDGESRLLGDKFDVRIVSTWNKLMRGKLYMTFGKAEAIGSGTPHPLHYGCMFWRPEITVMAPISRGNQTSQELMVNPSFRHVPLLPILASLTVTGIKETIDAKLSVYMHTV